MSPPDLVRIGRFFGIQEILPTGSGTAGLYAALKALGVKDRKVIVPALTCPNVAVAVVAAGGKVIPAGVHPRDFNIDPNEVRKLISGDVAAVIAVNSFGYPARLGEIKAAAREVEAVVIEDASQSYGGETEDGMVGARADVGVVSFGYSKPVALSGGGLLLVREPALRDRISWECQRLSAEGTYANFKNAVAVRLMKNGHERSLLFAANRLSLLNYMFPPVARRRLDSAWRRFEQALADMKRDLLSARALIAELPCSEPFDYSGEDWLPWRLSFKAEPGARRQLRALLAASSIATSELYPQLPSFLTAGARRQSSAQADLASRVVNLRYATDPVSTGRLLRQLEILVEEYARN